MTIRALYISIFKHVYMGASRCHLCDSTAYLLVYVYNVHFPSLSVDVWRLS